MTQENKELLLKDLCARLPYGVKFLRESWNYEWDQELSVVEVLEDVDNEGYINHTRVYKVWDIKPYLRPMSSMTEEEYDDMFHQLYSAQEEFFRNCSNADTIGKIIANDMVRYDWLNKKMFDYRGLIPKGLAIAVTEENNPYKG